MAYVIPVANASWGAPGSYMQALCIDELANAYINGGGETVPYQPEDIADMVRGGMTWIDYCGWPMYYANQEVPNGNGGNGGNGDTWPPGWEPPPGPIDYKVGAIGALQQYDLGSAGFAHFLAQLGMSFSHTFKVPADAVPYERSLTVGSATLPRFLVPNLSTPHTKTVFSSFGIGHPSGGWYFYAYGQPDGVCITPDQFLPFLRQYYPQRWAPSGGFNDKILALVILGAVGLALITGGIGGEVQ